MKGSVVDALRAESPAAAELAVYASIAARVDRALLRALRLTLMPDADASIESDLWFADIVQRRGSADVELDTDALTELRDELRASGKLEAARAVIARVRRAPPPLLELEEDLIYLGLGGVAPEEIDERLGAAVATLREQPARALDVASWALLALPRLPASVRGSAAAWSLALGAEGRTGYAAATVDRPSTIAGLAAALDERGPTTTLTVHRGRHMLELRDERASGPSVMTVPVTTPRVVDIEGVDERQVVLVPPGGRARVEVRDREPVVGNLHGQRWAVSDVVEGAPMRQGAVRYIVLPWVQVDRERERDVFDRIAALRDDLRQVSFAPDLVFVVGDLTNRARSQSLEDQRSWNEVVERLHRELARTFPQARTFLVPGAGDFRIPGQDHRAGLARSVASGAPVGLDGPTPASMIAFGAAGSRPRLGRPPPLVVATTRLLNLNSALADGKLAPSRQQLLFLCEGDRVDWARRHDLTFLVTDVAAQLFPPSMVRDVEDSSDVVIAARRASEPDLRFFVRGGEPCGYRRGIVAVEGLGLRLFHELRVWGRAGYSSDRANPAVEQALTRRRRPAGPHARLVRDVASLLVAGRRVLLAAPPGHTRADLVAEVLARLEGESRPVLAPIHDDPGDLAMLRDAPDGAVLASAPLAPYGAELLLQALDADVRVASDLDDADLVDLCAETGADSGAVLRGSRGHPGVARDLLDELRRDPTLSVEDRGAALRESWWRERSIDIRSLAALEELERCRRRGWSVAPVLGRDPVEDQAVWHLLAAGVLRRRGDGDSLHWLVPPWLDDAWVGRARAALGASSTTRRCVEVETRLEDAGAEEVSAMAVAVGHTIAATGWAVGVRSSSTVLSAVDAASTAAGADSTHLGVRDTVVATIVCGGQRSRDAETLALPVASVPRTVRAVQSFLLGIDGLRSSDLLLDELGVVAGIGVAVDAAGARARNRLTGAEMELRVGEDALLRAAGAVTEDRRRPRSRATRKPSR